MSLTPTSIVTLAASLVPSGESGSDKAELKKPIDALLLTIHAIHSQLGFRLVPTSEGNVLDNATGLAKLKYRHEQSSLEYEIGVNEIGGRGVVHGVVLDDHNTKSLDVRLTDYLSPSSFPATLSPSKSLETLFATPTRLADFITLYRLNILQPLIPGLRKEGYTELEKDSSSSGSGNGSAPERATSENRPMAGRGGYHPDPGGPLGIGGGGGGAYPHPQNPRGGLPALGGGRNPYTGGGGDPFNIGRSDLDPFANSGTMGGMRSDPLRLPGTGGMGGIGGGGGGMFMGPDHPLFGGRGGGGGGRGQWGGDGYLPPMGAPPGARFDPVGPANGPPQPGGVGIGGFGGGQGIGQFPGGRYGGGGGGGGGGAGGIGEARRHDPDFDELLPPGNGDEFRPPGGPPGGPQGGPRGGNSGNSARNEAMDSMFG